MPATKGSLSLLTLNVNGLGDPSKVACLCNFLSAAGDPDVVMLQELKLSSLDAVNAALRRGRGPGMPYRAAAYCSLPDQDGSRGVAILIRQGGPLDGDELPDTAVHRDAQGRFVRVDVTLLGLNLSLCCTYAPAFGPEKGPFFRSLHDLLPTGRIIIMGGDFNCITDRRLDQSLGTTGRLAGARDLQDLLNDFSLQDVYRKLHPDGRAYTHTSTATRSGAPDQQSSARLDRWYVSEGCMQWSPGVRFLQGAPGDHTPVLLTLSPPGMPAMGPGRPSFPTHILYDAELCQSLSTHLEAWLQAHPLPSQPSPGDKYELWLRCKAEILNKGICIARHVSATHSRRLQALMEAAEAAAAHAAASGGGGDNTTTTAPSSSQAARNPHHHAPSGSPSPAEAARRAVAKAQRELCAQSDKIASGLALLQADHGEKCQAWHFHQAGAGLRSTVITELSDRAGVPVDLQSVVSGSDLFDVVWEHFASDAPDGLFKVGNPCPTAQTKLLSKLQRKLSQSQAKQAEGPEEDGSITAECLQVALSACTNGKAPGRDGLPYEVYKHLWPMIGDCLVDALGDIFQHGARRQEWSEGIICLVYKGKGLPRTALSSYRPITLLNTDIRLVGRVISDRLQVPLDFLIDPAQTAFIKGRWIGDNILSRQALQEYLEASVNTDDPQAGCLIFLDITKAYDRVDRGWLMRVAREMGFGAGMLTWMERLMEGTTCRVAINGFLTPPFNVNNGLPQGGPAAPLFWVLQMEPFTAALRAKQRSGKLRTPTMRDGQPAPPISLHADDSKLVVCDFRTDGRVALKIKDRYCLASNSDMRNNKAKGICMGAHERIVGVDEASGVDFGGSGGPPLLALGVPCTTDPSAAADAAYPRRIASARGVARLWSDHPLSMVGRALNAKQVIASIPAFDFTFVNPTTPTRDYLGELNACIINYLARSSAPEDKTLTNGGTLSLLPKARIANLPKKLGGFGTPDLASQLISLQAKTLALAVSPGPHPWKSDLLSQLTAAAPHPRWGPVWAFTDVAISAAGALSPRAAAFLHAYRLSLPSPAPSEIVDAFPARALLLMPLFHTRHLLSQDGSPFSPPDTAPSEWPFTLGQLAAAPAALRQHPVLRAVEGRLPATWCNALELAERGEGALRQHDEWWLSACGGLVRRGRLSGTAAFFAVPASGFLVVLEQRPSAAGDFPGTWRPACVLPVPKPRSEWTEEERDHYEAARSREERDAARPMANRLLGAWADIKVFPNAWHHGALPLSAYTAANVRLRLTMCAAGAVVRPYMPDFTPGKGILPRLWEPRTAGAAPAGLRALEEGWLAAGRRGAITADAGAAAIRAALPPGMRLDAPRRERPPPTDRSGTTTATAIQVTAASPSPPPRQRQRPASNWSSDTLVGRLETDIKANADLAAAGAPAANAAGAPSSGAPLPDPAATAKYWDRLWKRVPVSNAVKSFGVRLLHAALPCRAMHAAMQSVGDRDFSLCQCCGGRDSNGRRCPETYTHLFLECPSYRPAIKWLLDLWEELEGERPPETAAVIISDEPGAWPNAPARAKGDRWQALRLTLLYYIWHTRCSEDASQRHARAAVAATVEALREDIRLQFNRAFFRAQLTRSLPPRVQRMQRRRPSPDAFAIWDHPLLAAATPTASGVRELNVLLDAHHPVPLPPEPP